MIGNFFAVQMAWANLVEDLQGNLDVIVFYRGHHVAQ